MKLGNNRIRIFDYDVVDSDLNQFIDIVLNQVRDQKVLHVTTINPEIIIQLDENQSLQSFIKQSDYIVPDGVGLCMAIKQIKKKSINRIPGSDIVNKLININCSSYLIGSTQKTINSIMDNKDSMKMKIVGSSHGFISHEHYDQQLQKIKALRPDFILVGMGSPKQYEFIQYCLNNDLDYGCLIGVGGVFEILAGEKKRSPLWLQQLNLEWLFRIYQDPVRIKRLSFVGKFILKCMKENR